MRYRLIAKCKRGNKTYKYQDVFFQKMATLEKYVDKQKAKYGDNYSYFIKGLDLEEICQAQEEYDSKCDNCNCAMRDCSLCGVSSFDETDDGTPIC